MRTRKLSAELVRHLFSYDPEEGILRWKNPTAYCMKPGDLAGSLGGKEGNKYLYVSIGRRLYKVHRVIWCMVTGEWPVGVVDHRDGDSSNNLFANLRDCTQAENCRNQRLGSANKSGFKGVNLESNGRFRAQICVNYRKVYLGMFDSAEEAHVAYVKAASEFHGDFARAA